MYIQTLTVAAAIGLSSLAVSVRTVTPSEPAPGSRVSAPEPPASHEVLARGKKMFLISCSPCHGADGTGNGPIASNLRYKPRDFTRGIYLNRSTASGELPTDYDLFRTITTGLHNTAMPSFRQMAPGDRWDIVQYIKTFSPRFNDSSEYPLDVINVGSEILPSPQSLARGRELYLQMQCTSCHGIRGQGDGPASSTLSDDFRNQIWPTDLTNASEFKFGRSVLDIFRIFSTGLNGTPMPSYAQTLSDTDRWHLANYVWSLQNTDQYVDGVGADSLAGLHGPR
ncbi:MAG: c-type cytochrome [Bacteroidota bacterium]|nr:c-type cytochrome [Bacteroidota bacterium]MDP4232440.1 c-type cytochrome [Bacteroidota bacterium]MDP4241576.1 c-type cytochrome [Bacteroidota bacterium]MDP4286320.1 c-type cytochrome [Bacteroidota bacterium]